MSKALRREGDPDGPPEVGYDEKKHRYYHLNAKGEPVFHGVPEGHHFRGGALVPQDKDAATVTPDEAAGLPGGGENVNG